MIKTIIFDLDGVLVDTKKIHFEALNSALKKYKCDLVPIYIERKKKYHFKMYISKPIKLENKKSINEITEHLNNILEKMIMRNIDQWIWTHDRWKK